MKIMKKILSVVMSAVMLISTNTALQAVTIDTAQMQDINELRENIIKEVNGVRLYPDIPTPEELQTRYAQAVSNNKANAERILEELKAESQVTEEQEAAAKGFVEELRNELQQVSRNSQLSVYGFFKKNKNKYIDEETMKLIKQIEKEVEETIRKDDRYKKIKDKNERKRVALYTNIFHEEDGCSLTTIGKIYAAITLFLLAGGLLEILLEMDYDETLLTMLLKKLFGWDLLPEELGLPFIIVGVVMAVILIIFTNSYVPEIAFAFDDQKVFQMFTEKPFDYLAEFKNIAEYMNIYDRNHEAAQVLNDAVYIEYYLSLNPNPSWKDVKGKIYTQTIDWYDLTAAEKAEYLHNFAERLRTESQAQIQESRNSHSQRVGLTEK